jgi:hypothetical protein
MKAMFWLAILVSVAAAVLIVRYIVRKQSQREHAAEARAAEFLAQMAGAKPAAPAPVAAEARPAAPARGPDALEAQKLLFDAARKAGEAGEPALALQLYERLLARFPGSAFAGEARAAAEGQKKRLMKR